MTPGQKAISTVTGRMRNTTGTTNVTLTYYGAPLEVLHNQEGPQMTTTTEPTSRFDYVTPNEVFAALADGDSVSVVEWPRGDLVAHAQWLERRENGTEGVLLVEVDEDCVGGTVTDRVSMHPDEDARIKLLNRGIRAMENARDALIQAGYVDLAHRPESSADGDASA
jgi:hypothetical protein